MTDVVSRLVQTSFVYQHQHDSALQIASSRADDSPLVDAALSLFVESAPVPARAPRWIPSADPRDPRSIVSRFAIEASALDAWLRRAKDTLAPAAGPAAEQEIAVDARWDAIEHIERETGEIGRRLLLEASASTRARLLTRVLVVHVLVLTEMRREIYGDRRGRFAEPAYARACFAWYADALRVDLAAAVVERLAHIARDGAGGIADAWATDTFKEDWRDWYAKVRVFDPQGSEFHHYLARVSRDAVLELQDEVVHIVRRCAALVGAPEHGWYAAPRPLRYGDVVHLHGGSPWPVVGGGAVGEDGRLEEEDTGAGWILVSAADKPRGSDVLTGEPFQLQSTSGGRFLHDLPVPGAAPIADGPQQGGSFFLRAMEVKPNKPAELHLTYFLVGVHSGAYLQATPGGDLLLRPWSETEHAGPDFPTWCFTGDEAAVSKTRAVTISEKDLTLSVLSVLSTFSPDPVSQFLSVVGTVVGLLWPSEPTPTWDEIKAYFQREISKALSAAELKNLSDFIDGIERRLLAYKANVDKFKDDKDKRQSLCNEITGINATILQDLSKFLYPAYAPPSATLPYFWKVSRYKSCILKEIECYEQAAVDIQYQLDSFADEARPVIVTSVNQLMADRMNAISTKPERYNEGFGQYHLKYTDKFIPRTCYVSNSPFLTTSNCSATVDYTKYNAAAEAELAQYRRSIRDSYLALMVSEEVDLFNALAKLTTKTPPISLKPSGNDGWSLT